jgi:hypothetical protein
LRRASGAFPFSFLPDIFADAAAPLCAVAALHYAARSPLVQLLLRYPVCVPSIKSECAAAVDRTDELIAGPIDAAV